MTKAKQKSYAKHLVESCPYGCPEKPVVVRGDRIYPHLPEAAAKKYWLCNCCGAYVGCHAGTNLPLGRLANRDLRRAKIEAHREFDAIWRSKLYRARILGLTGHDAKGQNYRLIAYGWLAESLGISRRDCHIGMFDLDRCRRVIEICKEAKARYGESVFT